MRIGIVGYCNPFELKDFLFSGQDIPNINKSATAVNTLVKELLQKGHSVKLFTTFSEKGNVVKLYGNNLTIFLCSRYCSIPKMAFFSRIYMVSRLVRVIKSEIHDLNVLHAHWTYEFALAAKHFSNQIPVFCTVRDWCPYILSMQVGIKAKIYWSISWLIFKQVMKGDQINFIANSFYTYERIKAMYPYKDVKIIPNPIQKEYILDVPKQRIEHPVFISICQNIEEKRKNVYRLILAFQLYHKNNRNATLMLIGNGATEGNKIIAKWKKQNLLSGVRLCGYVNHDKLMNLIDCSTALIHPSLEETFGNILLEGMARGKLCIGGEKSGAVPQVLGNGKYGLLCDVENINSMVKAMEIANDEQIVRGIVKQATTYLKENYSSTVIADKHIALYKTIMNVFPESLES